MWKTFFRRPADLLGKKDWGCPYCTGNHNYSTEEYVEILINYYGNSYDFSKVDYVNNSTPIEIICPIHGSFYRTPNSISTSMRGGYKTLCPICKVSEGELCIYNYLTN